MFFQLFISLGLLHYGGCGNWSIQYARNVYEPTTTCITIQCTYTYPPWHQLKAEVWTASETLYGGKQGVIVYHTNKAQIHPRFRGRTMFFGQMNGDCTLTINDLELEDQGEYGFTLETDQRLYSSYRNILLLMNKEHLSRQRDFCKLNIHSPEVFEEEKEAMLTCSGDLCRGTLYPQWYNHSVEKINGRTSIADYYDTASLSITPSWQDDGKEIQCVAYYGRYRLYDTCRKSSKTTLHVRYSPKWIQIVLLPSHNKGSNAEDTVLLMCLVVASNPPVSKYTWYKDGSQIPNESLQIMRIENMVKTAALERFTCAAHNEIGSSLSSPFNFVTSTEKIQIPTSCSSCTFCPIGLLIIILVAAVIAMAISVAVSTWCCLKNKKKSNAATATELAPISSNHISGNLVYTNVENPYTALDQTQISPDYEDFRRLDTPT